MQSLPLPYAPFVEKVVKTEKWQIMIIYETFLKQIRKVINKDKHFQQNQWMTMKNAELLNNDYYFPQHV